jgi:hypothetical protein
MLLLIVLVLVAVIAFYHYVQGFFSATLSAMIAIISAVVALGFDEPLVRLIPPKIPDQIHAVGLVVLFAAVYIVLRVIFDKYIPGNVQVPLMVDKIGAGIMGVVAAMFGVGVAVIAAQMLPFGPSIGGYTRYATVDTQTMQMANRNKEEGPVNNALKSDAFKPDEPQTGLLLPVDDLVVGTVAKLSDGGSLAGDQPLTAVHPALLAELFFDRLGIQPGTRHNATQNDVSFQGLFSPATAIPGEESEPTRTAPKGIKFVSSPSEIMLIARVAVGADAADSDGAIRMSPAGARIISDGKIYLPIGTLDQAQGAQKMVVRINHADDFLVAPAGAPVDFVYMLPRDAILKDDTKLITANFRIEKPAMLVVKRGGVIDLQNQDVKRDPPPAVERSLFRKYPPPKKLEVPPVITHTAAPEASAEESPFNSVGTASLGGAFVTPITVKAADDAQDVEIPGGKVTVRDKKLSRIQIDPTAPLTSIANGDPQISELDVPEGKKLVQITAETKASDRWAWAGKIAQTELVDAAGASYKPNGAWAKVRTGEGENRLVARYDMDAPLSAIPTSENGPTEIGYLFVVPSGVTIQEMRVDGKRVASPTLQVQ